MNKQVSLLTLYRRAVETDMRAWISSRIFFGTPPDQRTEDMRLRVIRDYERDSAAKDALLSCILNGQSPIWGTYLSERVLDSVERTSGTEWGLPAPYFGSIYERVKETA